MKRAQFTAGLAAMAIVLVLGVSAPAGLVSHWAFDEGTGTTAGDSVSGYGGTLSNGPVWTAAGKIGAHAIIFDGSNDRVVVNDDPGDKLNITGPITISAWIRSDNINQVHGAIYTRDEWNKGHSLLVKGDAGSSEHRKLWTNSGQQVGDLQSNTWYQVAKTYDGATARLYVNGAEVGSGAAGAAASTTHPILIGQEGYSGDRWSFDGTIDDVAVWDAAISLAQMRALYNLGDQPALNYDAGMVQALMDAYAAQGPAIIGGRTWYYSQALLSDAARDGELFDIGGGNFELVLDSAVDSGLTTQAPAGDIPEPASALAVLLGLGALARYRKRRFAR